MKENSNHNPNLGDQIKDVIFDAVNGQNYDQLNGKISQTIDLALDEARKGIQKGMDEARESVRRQGESYSGGRGTWQRAQEQARQNQRQNRRPGEQQWQQSEDQAAQWNVGYNQSTAVSRRKMADVVIPVNRARVRKVRSSLFLGFGIAGMVIFGGLTIAFGVMNLFSLRTFLIPTIFMGAFMAGSTALMAAGNRGLQVNKRLKAYLTLFREHSYCKIQELARVTNKTEKYVIKDIKKMISRGIFPEGHLDEKKIEFVGDNDTYQQYLATQENLKRMEADKRAEEERLAGEDEQMREVREAIESGKQFVNNIRSANDVIPGEEISKKLDMTELVVEKIFRRIEEKPEMLSDIRRFMQYYLPTTEKLIHAYKEFDAQEIQTENMQKSKLEIEKTMDTINEAFYNLYTGLYDDEVMDVSADISVLRTMFAQEGLTDPVKK